VNQAEINELIIEINEKSIILYGLESQLEKYPEIRQIADTLENPDNEWIYLYHLNEKNLLKDWYDVLSEIYYVADYKSEEEIDLLLKKIAKISKTLIEAIKATKVNLVTKEDKSFAQLLTKYLKQYKNYTFVTKNLQELRKDLERTDVEFKKLYKEFSNVSSKEKEINALEDKGQKVLKELEDKKITLNQMIDTEANSSLLKLYMVIASQEEKIADKYRIWALWIFAAIGSFLLIGFLIVSIQNWNHLRNPSFIEIKLGWDSLFKTLMLFSLTTPAWYLTKESSKHRQVAYKAKMLGTELAAFPLYAREFKDEDRLELRKNLADRFFGQELYGSSNPKADNSASSTEQIKLLAEMNKVTVEAIKVQQTLLGKKE
jgi:hypothetical protein